MRLLVLQLILLFSMNSFGSGCISSGTNVSCSINATDCIRSGTNVACGGKATECISAGTIVACGGKATECISAGTNVACGGEATECIRAGTNVACGGDTVPSGCSMKVIDDEIQIKCPKGCFNNRSFFRTNITTFN